ncbi:methyltransferase N6AMT1 [Cylas formicarius]|uniref:methyltransferase N6AMT1 n=1 Tax=Cylas formicarius TaxID=197179 RepID=UPI00295844E4|nr:methyltransferase N6AMT1 [Cylas formicarius]
MTLETPRYDLHQFSEVYHPAEDTFLFLDALEEELNFIQHLNPTMICEVGSGSGLIVTALATILKYSCAYFSTDINFQACLATMKTASMNDVFINSVNMNLLTCFKAQFDMIMFNPPYVPTDSSEVVGNGINRSWAGGSLGREVLDKFLYTLPDLLRPNGVCYLLLLKENKTKEIVEILSQRNFKSVLIKQRKIPGEHLFVYKFIKII